MKIGTRTAGNMTILDLSGKITLGDGNIELRNKIRELVNAGQKNILLQSFNT